MNEIEATPALPARQHAALFAVMDADHAYKKFSFLHQ